MNLGQRIKSRREEKGLTQDELAAISGVCQQMISKLETGRAQQTSDIVLLACALDVSPLWLEGLGEQPSNSRKKKTTLKSGESLHHKAVQTCLEFLLQKDLLDSGGFRKQAELFCHCYEMCTRPGNKTLSKQKLFALLRKHIR
jgi:transcriptional regulator with XRE-family HTH domain